MPLFAFHWGVGRGVLYTFPFFNFALSLYNSLHFGYWLPWILSGEMNKTFRVSELGIRSEVFSYENRKKTQHFNLTVEDDSCMFPVCMCFHLCDKML